MEQASDLEFSRKGEGVWCILSLHLFGSAKARKEHDRQHTDTRSSH